MVPMMKMTGNTHHLNSQQFLVRDMSYYDLVALEVLLYPDRTSRVGKRQKTFAILFGRTN